jgi:hypothetical protein
MNNKYIKKQEYKYTIIPETRMVVCECTTEINWWNLKNNIFHDVPNDWDKNVESVFKYNNCPVFTVRAVAKAHPDDVFDETKGKRIAKSKANIKAYRKILACFNKMLKSVQSVYQSLSEHESDLKLLSVREWFHLGNLAK